MRTGKRGCAGEAGGGKGGVTASRGGGPPPVGDPGVVLAVVAGVFAALLALVDHLLAQVRGGRGEAGHPVDDVDDQAEAVQVVEHDHVERGGRGALFLVAADVQVVVV